MITVIGNLKGGTGKSTVTFNLAVWLCLTEGEVTVIDLDPQKTLTDVASVRLEEGIEPSIHVQSGPFSNARFPKHSHETLIDVGTADLESFKQALAIADRVLIPVLPSQADIWSTQRFMQFLGKVRHGSPPVSVTFINRADTNQAVPASDEAAAALTALPGVRLIPQRLCDRAVFRNSFAEGLAVFELEPRSRASAEFRALAGALFDRSHLTAAVHPGQEVVSAENDPVGLNTLQPSAVGTETHANGTREDETRESRSEPGAGKSKKQRKGKKHKKEKQDKRAGKDRKDKKTKRAGEGKKGKQKKKGKKKRS